MSENRKQIFFSDKSSCRVYGIKPRDANIADCIYYPSVTSILGLKKDFSAWRSMEYQWQNILLHANTIGTLTHYKLQNKLASMWQLPPIELELNKEQAIAYNKWYDRVTFIPTAKNAKQPMPMKYMLEKMELMIDEWIHDINPQPPIKDSGNAYSIYPFEITLHSDQYGYAGSTDLIVNIDGKNELLDIKTTDKDDVSYGMQLIAYKIALHEMYPDLTIHQIRVLNLPKDEFNFNYIFTPIQETESLEHQFLCKLRDFYNHYKSESPINLYYNTVTQNLLKKGISITEDQSIGKSIKDNIIIDF